MSAYSWAKVSDDKGVSWGDDFRLLRAPHSMTSVTRLKGFPSKLEPIYLAAHNISITDGQGTDNSQRRWMVLSISKDGINFNTLGFIYDYDGKYTPFEPSIYEAGGQVLVSWSTMPKGIGGAPNSIGGMAIVTQVDKSIIQNYINGYFG